MDTSNERLAPSVFVRFINSAESFSKNEKFTEGSASSRVDADVSSSGITGKRLFAGKLSGEDNGGLSWRCCGTMVSDLE